MYYQKSSYVLYEKLISQQGIEIGRNSKEVCREWAKANGYHLQDFPIFTKQKGLEYLNEIDVRLLENYRHHRAEKNKPETVNT